MRLEADAGLSQPTVIAAAGKEELGQARGGARSNA